ncbi:MAG: phosphate/phosphite/phosphonate ABC transporter substrate-binding protein [Halanaerobium sp.]
MKNALRVLMIMLVVMIFSTTIYAAGHAEVWDKTDWPETLRIGVLPEEDVAVMEERYQPLKAHFEDVLGIEVELYFGTDFTAMIEAMRFKHIEASKFGPFSYILAADRAGAEAVAQGARDRFVPTYKSYIITKEGSGIETVADLEDSVFAWVDPASSSGYLFPRAHLVQETGIENDSLDAYFDEVIYSGGHDSSVRAVINGDVDAASVSDSQIQKMEAAEYPGIETIKVVTETRPIPRSPEAVRSDLPQSLKTAITFAYVSFNDEPFLTDHNYNEGFILVDDEAYDVVRDTAEALNLAPEDLL